MKAGINAWSVRADANFETMFREVKEAGFEGIELNVDNSGVHALTLDITDEKLDEIAALSDKYALPIVSISTSLWGGNMGAGTPEAFEKSKQILECQLRCAKRFGATGILTVPGGMSDTVTLKQAFENSRDTLKKLIPIIEEYKINVGVENVWNGFFTSPFDMATFVDSIGCEYVGAYYDLGNTIAFSRTEDWVDILGGRIKNAHIKGFKRHSGLNGGGDWVDISKSNIDWTIVKKALDEAGYTGYITAEVFKADENMSWTDYYKMVCGEINDIIK
ncbi:MAG: sugar phosphate isomerase/epimerase [Clostridiales bacterium]|nr:sugar phosphate isomerase/epimerase [Clostridiales bacterium]